MVYLSQAFRGAKRGEAVLGKTYDIVCELSTGGSIRCGLYVPQKADRITILFPIDSVGEGTMDHIVLPEPIPKAFSEVLGQL